MTDRLYYEDSYLTKFEATVLECEPSGGAYTALINRTAFYPTSGGQPYDTGTLGDARVTDVFIDEAGEVRHALDRPLDVGARVAGEIDWARRFDHMQQHAGEHMLASAVYRLLGGHTIGLHLGAEVSTIDVELPSGDMRVSERELDMLETDVNARVQRDDMITCYFPDAAALAALPLRKPPAVNEHVRVVQIGADEFCACGGTHPNSAGQVGLVKILDARPSRGKMRIAFVCGMRAFSDYKARFDACALAARALSTDVSKLPDAVIALEARARAAEYELNKLISQQALSDAPRLLENAELISGARVVAREYKGLGIDAMRDVASLLTGERGVVALLSDETSKGFTLVFARSADVNIDMAALIKRCALELGGKGGGKPDFAQGAALRPGALDCAMRVIRATEA